MQGAPPGLGRGSNRLQLVSTLGVFPLRGLIKKLVFFATPIL